MNKMLFRGALFLGAALVALVGFFVLTNRKCVDLGMRNDYSVALRDLSVRTRSADIMSLATLDPGERHGDVVCVNRSARWMIQYRVDNASSLTYESLDEVYIDVPGEVHLLLSIGPAGTETTEDGR